MLAPRSRPCSCSRANSWGYEMAALRRGVLHEASRMHHDPPLPLSPRLSQLVDMNTDVLGAEDYVSWINETVSTITVPTPPPLGEVTPGVAWAADGVLLNKIAEHARKVHGATRAGSGTEGRVL